MIKTRALTFAAVAAAAAMLIGCGGVQSSPAKVVEAFVEATCKDERAKALGYFNPDVLAKGGQSKIEMAITFEHLKCKELGGFKSLEITDTVKLSKAENEVVRVTYKVSYKGGETRNESSLVTKFDNRWFVGY